MFSTTSNKTADPLGDASAAEHFVRALPSDDPVAAQRRVCAALSDFCTRDDADKARLRALLTLDVHARPLLDRLLVNFLPGSRQPRSIEAPCWQGAFELVRAFGGAHGHALRSMRGTREHLPLAVLRMFEHRRIELMLRPFADERSSRFPWKELHSTYKLARSSGVLHQSYPVTRPLNQQQTETTLEREYILVLLQDLVNGGQLPPQDAFWTARRFVSWSQAMTLESHRVGFRGNRFGIDLDGDGGPARVVQESADHWRYFDMESALESIDAEVASLREGREPGDDAWGRRGRRVALLRKIREMLKPERRQILRRGDRGPVALTVEIVAGMAQIVGALRSGPDGPGAVPHAAPVKQDDETFTTGGFAETHTDTLRRPRGPSATGDFDTPHPPLTMVDRSDSGCRLHGPTHPLNPIVPGTLVAFREVSTVSWTIGVVRRVRKRLGGKRVELGVEFLGNDARGIVVVPDSRKRSPDAPVPRTEDRFAAIYLPESASYPTLPVRTLILPPRGLKADDRLTVPSQSEVRTIALKEAFEEQADFLWAPFDLVDPD